MFETCEFCRKWFFFASSLRKHRPCAIELLWNRARAAGTTRRADALRSQSANLGALQQAQMNQQAAGLQNLQHAQALRNTAPEPRRRVEETPSPSVDTTWFTAPFVYDSSPSSGSDYSGGSSSCDTSSSSSYDSGGSCSSSSDFSGGGGDFGGGGASSDF